MSTVPLATAESPTLADTIGDTLAAAFTGHKEPCLWCGGSPVQVISADLWTGAITVRCPRCGTELNGTVARKRREVRT
jgi:hypothetical protein